MLKVLDETLAGSAYTRTLDNYTTAEYTPEQRLEILKQLGIDTADINKVAVSLVTNYIQNRKQNLQLVALLGVICSNKDLVLDDEVRGQVMAFLVNKLQNGDPKLDSNSNNVLKRQCLLSLALARKISPEAMRAVVKFYETETNNYCLSPMAFFFLNHASDIKALSDGQALLSRVSAVNSMYTTQVAEAVTKGLKRQADSLQPILPTASAAAPLKAEELEAIGGQVAAPAQTTAPAQTAAPAQSAAPAQPTTPAQTAAPAQSTAPAAAEAEEAPLPNSVF